MQGIIAAHCTRCNKVTPQRILDSDYKMSEYFMQITKCLDCCYANEFWIDLKPNKKGGNDDNNASLN